MSSKGLDSLFGARLYLLSMEGGDKINCQQIRRYARATDFFGGGDGDRMSCAQYDTSNGHCTSDGGQRETKGKKTTNCLL